MNSRPPIEPPKEALTALLKLRDYYAPKVEEYEKLYTQAKESLNHVEALLLNGFFPDEIADEKSTPVEPVEEENSLLFKNDESNDNTLEPTQLEFLKLDDSQENSSDEATDINELPEQLILPLLETETLAQEDSSLTLPLASLHRVEIPMLPQYQSLSRPEAVKQLLFENKGRVCHIDFIVESLYGDLEPQVFQLVKDRVQSTLTHGRKTNQWSGVPGQRGCFTLALNLLTKTKNQHHQKSFRKPDPQAIPMLAQYEGEFLIDALTTFLEENSGEVFTVAEVITGIYGNLNGEEIREVKNKVLNELSRGYRTGRFSRMPEQIGVYTWDYKLVKGLNK